MKNSIEIKNVSKKYPGFALKNINFCVPEGTIVGLIGENGAGKTTTIKALLNIISSLGDIQVLGKNIRKHEKEIKQDIGVVLDNSFLSEYLTTKKLNTIMKDFYNNWDEKKYMYYIKEFQLPENQLIKEFSSGMKMKLKIAIAISHHPKLLILDEPTSGLDRIVRNEILEIFRKYIEEDETRAILISSHITSDLEHISDYIVLIDKGEIKLDKATTELLENYGIVKCSKEDFEKIKIEDYISYRAGKYQYEVLVADKYEFRRKYDISVIDRPTIEDIMLFYIKGGKA